MELKIKNILSIVENLKNCYGLSLFEINDKLKKECRIFIHDNLQRTNYCGMPDLGQIIIGRKFWHYQLHIAVVTNVEGKEKYDCSDLTKTNEGKSIPLKWRDDIPEDKKDIIVQEIETAEKILKTIEQEKNNKRLKAAQSKIDIETEKVKKALEFI